MSFSSLRIGTLGASALLGLLLIPTSATAQEEEEVLMRPVPAGVFSESIVTVAYIPLDDVAQALGARLQFDSNRNTYTAQPHERGVLRINPEHVMGVVIEDNANPEIGRDRMGVVIEDRPAPEDDSERVAQGARLSAAHQPSGINRDAQLMSIMKSIAELEEEDKRYWTARLKQANKIAEASADHLNELNAAAAQPAAGEPGTPKVQASSFEVGGHLVSRGIIIVGGRPYMPLDDFAAAIGVSVEQRVGISGLIYMFNPQPEPPDPDATPLLELSRRGRSLIEGRQP